MKIKSVLAGLAVAALFVTSASAQVTLPQVPKVNSTDLVQVIPNGVPTAQSQYATTANLVGFGLSAAAKLNALIGGDATTNLFQRATTGSSVTTTFTYGGPDRWGYWSGTNTAMTVSRTTSDVPTANYPVGFKMARTSGQTGVVPVCMLQALETNNSVFFQGQTAEVDFYAAAGSNFSAASGTLSVSLISGTGTNESAAAAAFGLNAGGGGGAGWTGQANQTDTVTLTTTSTRYAAIFAVPSTATQLAVSFCFTPVGTASTNDYVTLAGLQLVRNASLASLASRTTATACSDINCNSFDRRLQGEETDLQQRYFYKLTETSAIAPVAPCAAVSVTVTNCLIQLPVTMRIAPTGTFANGFATPTSTTQATLGACNTLAAATTVTSTVGSVNSFLVSCTATTVPAAGVASFLYSNNGTGTISLSAEL